MACLLLGSTKVLVFTDKPKKHRNVKYTRRAFQRKRCVTYFLPRKLGLEVPGSLGNPRVFSKARPYLLPQAPTLGPERANSLDDLCTICMARVNPQTPTSHTRGS